jgi:HEAT repeat protein
MTHTVNPELSQIAQRLAADHPAVRRVAIMDLAEVSHEPGAEQLFLQALGDPVAEVRAEAAKVIDEFPPETITDALIKALTAPDNTLRVSAARALADLKDPEAGAALLQALELADDPFVLEAVLHALKNLQYAPALDAGLRLTLHAQPGVRREAVGLLGYLRHQPSMQIIGERALADSHPEVRRQAVAALVGGESATVGSYVSRALKDENWQVRAEGAGVLARLRIPASLEPLIQAAADPVWQVREKAAQALGALGSREAIPALGRCAADPVSNLRKTAIAALGEIGDRAAEPYLYPALEDSDPDVRKIARWALSQLRPEPRNA